MRNTISGSDTMRAVAVVEVSSANVKRAAELAGFETWGDLAKAIGVSWPSLSQALHGRKVMGAKTYAMLEKVLGWRR